MGLASLARPRSVILPTVMGWNLTVQQELNWTMSLQGGLGEAENQAYHNMFDSSPSYNTNQLTPVGIQPGCTLTISPRLEEVVPPIRRGFTL